MPKNASFMWWVVWSLASLIRPFYCRFHVEGRENVPLYGSLILASNHNPGLDFCILGLVSPRQIYFMAKIEIFRHLPWLKPVLISIGTFPVNRSAHDVGAVRQAVQIVRDGYALGMYPEGTRSRTGALQKAKTGAARIAMEAAAPVVPVVVINSPAVLKGPFLPWKAPLVTVRFGPVFTVEGDANDGEQARANTEIIMRHIAALLPPEMQGEYALADSVEIA